MNEMIEQVARAIDPHEFELRESLYQYCLKSGDNEYEAKETASNMHPCTTAYQQARAAIEAMREPSKAMVRAGRDVEPFHSTYADIFRAMINAALEETQ